MSYYHGYAKPRRVKTKKQALQLHAYRRAGRFDIELTREVRSQILKLIKHNKSLVLPHKSTNSKKAHLVIYQGKVMLLIYDKKRKEIVTFLIPNQTQIALAEKNAHILLSDTETMH